MQDNKDLTGSVLCKQPEKRLYDEIVWDILLILIIHMESYVSLTAKSSTSD